MIIVTATDMSFLPGGIAMTIIRLALKILLFPLFLILFTADMFVKMFFNLSGFIAGVLFLIGIGLIIYCVATHIYFGVLMTFIAGIMVSAAMLALGWCEHIFDMAVELYQDF